MPREGGSVSRESEMARLKLVLFLFIFFCVSGFKSCQELKYAVSSKTATCTVNNVTERTSRRGGHVGYKIWYSFRNENTGKMVKGYTETGLEGQAAYPEGTEVEIEYIGAKMFSSRIIGTGSVFWPVAFVLMTAGLVVGVVLLVRAAPKQPG